MFIVKELTLIKNGGHGEVRREPPAWHGPDSAVFSLFGWNFFVLRCSCSVETLCPGFFYEVRLLVMLGSPFGFIRLDPLVQGGAQSLPLHR